MFFVGRIWLMLETGMTSNERKNLDAWKQKKKKEQARQKKDLLNKLSKEIDSIIENNIKIIAAAYRKSVTSNSFGKKNYNKFISELAEFIEDNSKVSKKLKKDYDFDLAISLTDGSVIGFIENEIEELYQNADYTDEIDPFEYEYYCAGEFKKNGWIAEVTQGSSDQGVDVKASKDGIDLVAQCKRFTKPVGNKAVQEVVAGIKHYAANKGIVIAPNGFTKSAEKLAESNNIDLIHHSEIKDL
tara:strand:- start:14 stop:742 length:729 start_codon:yes stop_codon:yes gene_type:complete